MKNTKKLVEWLEALCLVDSRTIEGAEGATKVSAMLGETLKSMDFELEWLDATGTVPPRGRHLKAVRNPGAERQLLLLAHSDTVLSPEDVPFRVDWEKGLVFGSGVADMKGGCVVMLEAIRLALQNNALVQNMGITVLLNSSEEQSEPSFRKIAKATAPGMAASLNFEPSRLNERGFPSIVTARKGMVQFYLKCEGRAAHAGNAHSAGVNAIREVARKIEQIESLTDLEKDMSANVGRVVGGLTSNQVADYAETFFEVRAFRPDYLAKICQDVRDICSTSTVRSAADGVSTKLTLDEDEFYPPWPGCEGTRKMAQRYLAFAEDRGFAGMQTMSSGGASDSCHIGDIIPALDGLGIRGGTMHSPHEWADLHTLPVQIQLACDMICWLAQPDSI